MSSLIDIAQLLKYENIALWVAFAAILAALVYSLIRGAFRGWAYGTYRLAFFAILVVVCFATLSVSVDGLGKFDLTRFIHQSISIPIQDKTIDANVSTLHQTIADLLTDLIREFDLAVDSANLESFVNAYATSIIKFVLIIIEGIFLMSVGSFLCWFFWHILFKHFIPKMTRKRLYKKGRIFSMLEEFVVTLVVGAMVVIPITGTINMAVNSFQTPDTEEENSRLMADNETYKTVKQAIDTYNDSVFSKVFFNWTRDKETGRSFDSNLLSYFTMGNITDEVAVSFVDVVGDAAKIGSLALEAGLLSQEGTTFDKVYLLLTSQYGPRLISAVGQSKLVTSLLPIGLEIATNLDTIKDYIGSELGIDYYGYDYAASIEDISKMLSDLQSSDVFTFFTDVDGAAQFDTDEVASLFSEKSKAAFTNLFARLARNPDEKSLVNDLLSVFLVNMALNNPVEEGNLGLASFLPELSGVEYREEEGTGRKIPTKLNDAYKGLSLGDEIQVLYNGLYDINALDDRLTALIVDAAVSEEHKLDTDVLLEIVVDHVTDISKIIAGDASIDSDSTKTCLMDCTFLTYAMPNLLDFAAKQVGDATDFTLDVSDVRNELFAETLPFATRQSNAKTEMRGILSLLTNFVEADPVCKEFVKHIDAMPGIVFEKDGNLHSVETGLVDGFIALAEALDNSKLLTSLIPQVADQFLTDNEALKQFGIEEIHTDIDGFGHELASMLRVAKECLPLISYVIQMTKALDGSSRMTYDAIQGLAEYADNSSGSCPLLTLLNGITTNRILNDSSNENYRALLESVFKMFLSDDTISIPSTVNPLVENEVVTDFLFALGTEVNPEMLDKMLNGGDLSLDILNGLNLSEILRPLDSSEVLPDILANFLDDRVLPLLDTDMVSFHNVNSWETEGESLERLITFAVDIGDLANIDFFASDPEAISGIIACLADNELFEAPLEGGGTKYVFGEFLYSKLIALGDSVLDYMKDRDATSSMSAEEKTTTLKADLAKMTRLDWVDEAPVFGDVIRHLQDLLNGVDFGSSFDLSSLDTSAFGSLFASLKESSSVGRVFSYHLFEQVGISLKGAHLEIGPGDFGNLNIDYLWEAWDNGMRETNLSDEFGKFDAFLAAVMDPSYGMLDSAGQIDIGSFDLSSSSGKFLIEPVLENLSTSIIFNTLSDNAPSGESTAFEYLLVDLIAKSKLYGPNNDATRDIVKLYVSQISPDTANIHDALASNRLSDVGPWAVECKKIADTVTAVRNLGISLDDFDITSMFRDEHGDPLPAVEGNAIRLAFYDVLSAINESKVLYRALPMKLADAIDSVSATLDDSGCANPNYYYRGSGLSADPYGDDEIETLSYIIYDAGSADLSGSDLASLDAHFVSDILARLASSHVFNSTETGTGLTYFHGILGNVFERQEVAENYYYAPNPKDNPLYHSGISYTDSSSKAQYYFPLFYPQVALDAYGPDEPNLEYLNGDSYSIKTFIQAVNEDPDIYTDLQAGHISSLSMSDITRLGKEIANNPLIADVFTNAIASMLNDEYTALEVKMECANPYYMYWLDVDNITVKPFTAEPNYSKLMPDSEIELIAELSKDVKDSEAMINALDSDSIDSSTINKLRDLMIQLQSSYVFHEAGAWLDMGTRTISSWQDDLTVFEQLFGMILHDSSLHERNYSSVYDSLNYSSAEGKLHDYIVAFNDGSLDSDHPANWLMEINNLTDDQLGGGLLKTMLDEGIIGSGLDIASFDVTSKAPGELSNLFKAIAKIDNLKEMLPYEISSMLFDTVHFDDYSSLDMDLAVTGSFDSAIALGDIGTLRSVTLLGGGDFDVSYSYDGTLWSSKSTVASGTAINLANARYFRVEQTSGSSLTGLEDLTFDSGNYFLSQESYYKEDGAIENLVTFLDALYTIGGGSYPDVHAGDSDSTETLLAVFTPLLTYLDDPSGFYFNAYDAHGARVTNDSSSVAYLARDIVMRHQLIFTYEQGADTYQLDSGRYFGEESDPLAIYHNIFNIFEDPNYSASVEGSWFSAHIVTVEGAELPLSGNIGSYTYGSYTIPALHMSLIALANTPASVSTYQFAFEEVLDIAKESLFGTGIGNGMLAALLNQFAEYGSSAANYFKGFATMDPLDDLVRQTAVVGAYETDGNDLSSLADVFVSGLSEAMRNVLVISSKLSVLNLSPSNADKESAKAAYNAIESDIASADPLIQKLYRYFYDSIGYEGMLNHNYYYDNGMTTVTYPDAFASGFSFNDVANAIV